MAGWTTCDGSALALPFENIDTDQLIPSRFMSVPRSDGYGPYLLHDLRDSHPEFPLNLHPQASVLISRRNFGSGSSREAAVYALVDYGIRAVIAPSFGDIFAGNAVNNGLLPARMDDGDVEALIAALGAGTADIFIDLEAKTVTLEGQAHRFELGDVARQKLINGWDDIDLTANHGDDIASYRAQRIANDPWAWPTTNQTTS